MAKEIDIKEVIDEVKGARKVIILISGALFAIGAILGLTTPNSWSTGSTLMLESKNSLSLGGGFGGFADLAGIDLGQAEGNDLNPEVYSRLIDSPVFLVGLLNHTFSYSKLDDSFSLKKFLVEEQRHGLIASVLGVFETPESFDDLGDRLIDGYLSINMEEIDLLEEIRSHIGVAYDKKNKLVSVSTTFQDPLASAAITGYTIDYLTKYSIDYQTEKEKQNLEFITNQLNMKKAEFDSIQNELALFQDQNIGPLNNKARVQLENLNTKFDLAFEIYSTLLKSQQESKLKLQEKIPVFTVLEPVVIPEKPNGRGTIMKSVIGAFLGVFLTVGFICGRYYLQILLSE